MARQRLGVALLFDDPVRTELLGLRRALGSPSLATQPPHLTLVPPVNVRDEDVDEAVDVVREAAAKAAPVRIGLGPAATFLPVSPVVFLAVDGDLDGLRALRDAVLRGPLQRRIDFPFVPHVTLHEDATTGLADSAVAALHAYRVEVRFDAVHLLREGPGRVWTPIADARMEPPVLRGRGGVEITFRHATVPAPDVRALLHEAGATTSEVSAGSRLAGQPWVLEAWEGGVLSGAATGVAGRGQWVITSLGISAGQRGRGIGTRLLHEVVAEAAATGAETVGVLFPSDSPDVPDWVARRGFVARHPRAGRARWLALPRG